MKNLFLLILAICSLCLPLGAQSQGGYTILSRHVDIEIHPDGLIDITEKLTVHFLEERRGIYRSIPYVYDVDGQRLSLKIKNISVKDHKFKVSSKGGDKKIRIGDPDIYLSGDQDYIISYQVKNGLVSYPNHDEFYWNLIDFDTDAQTDKASFKITYPDSWTGQITEYRAYSGRRGATDKDIVMHSSANELVGAAPAGLEPHQGITLAIKIPKGLLPDLNLQKKKHKLHWLFNLWNLIPVALSSILFFLYQKFERQEKIRDYPLQFYPPDDMTPAEVGTFVDHIANRRDIISLLPYWGNQGIIKIKPVEGSKDDMYFYKVKELPDTATHYEHNLFSNLFETSNVVLLSDLKEKFYSTMSTTASLAKKAVLERPLFDPMSKKVFHSGWMILAGVAIMIISILIGIKTQNVVVLIGGALIGIATIILHFLSPRLSKKGITTKKHLYGLRDFLKDPDPHKIKELVDADHDYLHKMYPYVLAFDLDKSWTKFEKNFSAYGAPIWLDYGTTSRPFSYSNLENTMNVRTIEKVFYSTPAAQSSSGGGGFSGGSAGGGFGGGSTGSW